LSGRVWALFAIVLLAACQRKLPDDVPSLNSAGVVPAAPKALGARAATLEPLPLPPEPALIPEPNSEEPEELELGMPAADGGVPL
jgi:hypothetical protein